MHTCIMRTMRTELVATYLAHNIPILNSNHNYNYVYSHRVVTCTTCMLHAAQTPYSSALWGCNVESPPSTASTWPVMKSFSGLRKNSRAAATCHRKSQTATAAAAAVSESWLALLLYISLWASTQHWLPHIHK